MRNISIKLNNASVQNFSYDNIPITVDTLISDIGKHLYPNTYNSKVNQYIKLIYMGKILIPSENLPSKRLGYASHISPFTLDCKPEGLDLPENANENYTFHCVIKNIPGDAFIIEESIEIEKVTELFNNQDFINIIKQKKVYEFIKKNLSNPDKIIKNLLEKKLIDKYKIELLLLNDMGFNYELELLELLEKFDGNVDKVINQLMS
jgi:hypothetical protein